MEVIDLAEETSTGNGVQKIKRKTNVARQAASKMQTIPNASTISQTVIGPNSNPSAITIPTDSCHIEKKCENPDCSAPTLISLVPTRRTAQFIHDPTVVPEPILVNGYTTVFEVGGITAKINELTTFRGPDGKIRYKSPKPIFRIIPNTHTHVVNYIIVDAEGNTLQKIKQNDPVTIKKLLDSQKNSAEQVLQKLIGIKKEDNQVKTTPINVTTSVPIVVPQAAQTSQITPTAPQVVQQTTKTVQPVLTPITTVRTTPKITPPQAAIGVKTTLPTLTPAPIVASSPSSVTAPVGATSTQGTSIPVDIENSTAFERLQSQVRQLEETLRVLTEQKGATMERPKGGGSDPKKQKIS